MHEAAAGGNIGAVRALYGGWCDMEAKTNVSTTRTIACMT